MRSPLDFSCDEIPLSAASLDLLTPLYSRRFKSLSEGEQILLYAIVERRANYPVGENFPTSAIPENERQQTRSHISSVVCSLKNKGVLEKISTGVYKINNPGFELWMRMRSLQMKEYNEFGSIPCPVLLNDNGLKGVEFWDRLCSESGVKLQNSPIRKRSPSRDN